jgi:hypothetical protein
VTFDFTTIDLRVVLAALAIIVAVGIAFYFQWWRNRKRLSYEILSNVLVVSAEEEVQDQVEIRYKGKLVTNVRLIVIKLINDGYQPIKKDDFQRSIKFVFAEAKVLSAKKVKLHPENLDIATTYFPNRVEVNPTLFNRKEYIQFKVLVSGYTGMKIDARIIGVSSIQKARPTLVPNLIFWLAIFAGAIVLYLLPISNEYWKTLTSVLIPFMTLMVGFALATVIVILKKR